MINVSGAFVIAFQSVLLGVDWCDRFGTLLKSRILTGVLGSYTTFSSMQIDAATARTSLAALGAPRHRSVAVSAGLAVALGAFMARLRG